VSQGLVYHAVPLGQANEGLDLLGAGLGVEVEGQPEPVRLPPRPGFLAGREELLTEVGTQLAAGDDPGPQTVALCGLGGAGKTSMAVEYAYRHLGEVGMVWQFAAEDATVLTAGFSELAARLDARGTADARDPVASVHAVLAGFATPWLLIEAAIPDGTTLPRTWPTCAALLPQVQAALDLTSGGMVRIAQYLGASGSYPAARDLFQVIAGAHVEDDAYGPEHPDTLASLYR
jgi:hypothetical protein